MTFQIDTSGQVPTVAGSDTALNFYTWDRLDPFTQGYIVALIESGEMFYVEALNDFEYPRFSDLAPETLARIIADGEIYLTLPGFNMEGSAFVGRKAWVQRQAGWPVAPFGMVEEYRDALPPLTVHLGDDGNVRFA